jgi:hypothetical protein
LTLPGNDCIPYCFPGKTGLGKDSLGLCSSAE